MKLINRLTSRIKTVSYYVLISFVDLEVGELESQNPFSIFLGKINYLVRVSVSFQTSFQTWTTVMTYRIGEVGRLDSHTIKDYTGQDTVLF